MTILFTAITSVSARQTDDAVIYNKDGIYEKITILDGTLGGRPTRFFQQDKSRSGAMFLDSNDPTDLVYEYSKYYSIYKIFKPEIENALVIGGRAYSIPMALLYENPDSIVDVVEIEPSLFELSKEYFNVKESPNLNNYTEDGRRFLRDSEKEYDLIFSDVYYSLFSIPSHFTTTEFFEVAKEKLSEDGIFIANLTGNLSRQEPSFIFTEIKTFKSVFPNSYFFAVESPGQTNSQNIIFVGYNSDKEVDFSNYQMSQKVNPIISSLKEKEIDLDRFELSPYPILTDNFAPVEHMTAKILRTTFGKSKIIDGEEMLGIISQQLRYGPRYPSSAGHKKTIDFLVAEMKEQTNNVYVQSWDYEGNGGEVDKLTNIIGQVNPEIDERIILATHYDSKRFADKDKTDRYDPVPGANDSASGVAVLLELSEIFNKLNTPKNIGIDFVFFDAEEGDKNLMSDYTNWEPIGSTYFAKNLKDVYPVKIPSLAIVVDMVCDKDFRIYKEPVSFKSATEQTNSFFEVAKKIDGKVFRDDVGQVIRNDHNPLIEVGIPSILLIDLEYPYHHTTKDTIDKCSAKSLETVAEAIYEYVRSVD